MSWLGDFFSRKNVIGEKPSGWKPFGYHPQSSSFDMPRYEHWQKMPEEWAREATGRTIDTSQQEQWRQQQQDLAKSLRDRAEGRGGPSPAELQMRRGLESTQAGAAAQAAASPSVNPALAARMAQQAQSRAGADVSGQAGVLRAQETQQAQQQLAGMLGQARGQDIDIQGQKAQNMQALAQLAQQYRQMGYSADEAQMKASMAYEQLRVQEALGRDQIRAQMESGKSITPGWLPAIMGQSSSVIQAFNQNKGK